MVDNFAGGLDTRKSPLTSPSGTLQRLNDCVITPGGEIAKRKAFVAIADLTGTFGLASTEATVYAFTKNVDLAPPALGVPGVSLVYQKIPSASATLVQADFDSFDGLPYLTCYDSALPTTDPLSNPHYYDDGTVAAGVLPRVYALTEGKGKGLHVRTYGTKMYGVRNKNLYFSAVGNPKIWDSDLPVTVTNLSKANPAVVTVAAADITKFTNNQLVSITGADATGMEAANGTHTISSVGTPANTFTLTGVDTSTAAAAMTTGVKATPINSARVGTGFINLSMQDSDGESLTSLEIYYDKLSVFSSEAAQLWAVDPDPLQNVLDQVLRGAGTRSPLATQQYGSGDVLYLSPTGIRSVRARDSSNSAAVSDIGSPIDLEIQNIFALNGATSAYIANAQAILEPIIGRFWMVFRDQIFVLSYFPGPSITAWSRFVPGFNIDYAVTCNGHIFLRSGNTLYAYGGADGNAYDFTVGEVRLPYLDMTKPGHDKMFEALDATMQGSWIIKNSFDYNNPDAEETLGSFSSPTWRMGRCEFTGESTHYSLRFYTTGGGPALLSNVGVHYKLEPDAK